DERRSCPEADAAEPDCDEKNGDRDHDVPPEDAWILEERRDAEVRRVRIRTRDVPGEEMSMRQALKERNRREQPGQRDECGRERARMPRTARGPRNGDYNCGERNEEEEELDRPLAQ